MHCAEPTFEASRYRYAAKCFDRIRASCHTLPQPQENEYELQGAQILKFKIRRR
ncbi:hypothetical protein [uncultured Campylobacter sp.]|uniref:hypothetical protein n=1 Tax=uncultured Campylobacter sp. TaxID=218934 RepID=UPI00261B4C44|nr:hypothetical protein [uncultured Campylobacter sp.]